MTTQFAILPEAIVQTLSARFDDNLQFLSLPHPRTGLSALFLPTPDSILEVQAISPPDGRSWFMANQVVEDGRLTVMTPIDPAFLLISLLQADPPGQVFRTVDDLFEERARALLEITDEKGHSLLKQSIGTFSSLPCVMRSLRHVCDVKEITADTTVYRYSSVLAQTYVKTKIARLGNSTSLEASRTIVRGLAKDGLMEDGKEKLLALGRMKASFDLVGQYLSPEMKKSVLASYDFSELESYLRDNASEQTAPLQSSTNTKKGAANKTSETDKKRKATKSSHGVAQLKKANTTGMSKLSSFFAKSEKAK